MCAPLYGQDDLTTWFSSDVRSYSFIDVQTAYSPSEATDDGDEETDWQQFKLAGLHTIYQKDRIDVALWASYQDVALDTGARLSQSIDLPEHMTSTRLGVTGRYVEDDWLIGLSAMWQDNGDDGIGGNEQGEQVSLFGHYQLENPWGFWLVLQQEGLVQDDFVVGGGVSYKSDNLNMRLGSPWAQIEWKFAEDFMAKAIYYGGPWYADVTWFWHSQWRSGIGFQQRHDGFYRDDRADDDHQFQIIQYQADIFVTHELKNYKYLSARLGWLFDRLAFEDDPYEDDGDLRLEIDDAPVLELSFSWWF